MDEPAVRRVLLDQIEFVPIGGEDRQSSLRGGQVDQGVVEAFLALVFLKIPDACIPAITPASMQVRSSGVNRRPTGTASKRTA